MERVCDALVQRVRRWWVVCDAFRAQVLIGYFVRFMNVDYAAVANAGEEVMLMLAKCNLGRMVKMLKEVRENVVEVCEAWSATCGTWKLLKKV